MAVGTGEAIVDFGTGADLVSIAIARPSVAAATTRVEANLYPKSTGSGLTDHSVEEHIVDAPLVFAHSIVDGVGFTISAVSPAIGRSARLGPDYLTGRYTVQWVATE